MFNIEKEYMEAEQRNNRKRPILFGVLLLTTFALGSYTTISNSTNSKKVIITVKKGDTLASITKKFYGDITKYQKIIMQNKSLAKNNKLVVGQKLILVY